MLMDTYCNENVAYSSLNSCWVRHLQNHYLKYWSFKRALVLSGGRNTTSVKERENDTNKNWGKDCFVTDGDENNVFNSKPKQISKGEQHVTKC